jgi:protein-tyrosine phosphatase
MIKRKVPGLYEIVPGLYQSGAPGTRNGPSVFELVQTGIDTVVCLTPEGRAVYPNQLSVIHKHFADCYAAESHPDEHIPEDLPELATFVRSLVGHGHNVLLSCRHGWNRSGLLSALVLVKFGYPASEAIAMVLRARGEGALRNAHFRTYLEALDA